MKIGIFYPTVEHGALTDMVERVRVAREKGFDSAWLPQSAGFDAITALAVIGSQVEGIELGTSVVPTYPRHPVMLAAQALTASEACGGRFALGVGLSHRLSIETTFGLSYDRPARHMREYLSILMPLLRDGKVDYVGETLTGRSQLRIAAAPSPSVLVAALQPQMLQLAGTVTDGTITWCTGPTTLEEQIVPLLARAASEAGRPAPRVVVPLPAIVCADEAYGREKAGEQLAGYGQIPTYRAVLDREGVDGPADISVVGDEKAVTAQLRRFAGIGATDFVAIPCGTADDRARTTAFLASLPRDL